MAADVEGLMIRAFPGNVCARVAFVAKWAFVRRGVAISLGLFAVVELAVNEFEMLRRVVPSFIWVQG